MVFFNSLLKNKKESLSQKKGSMKDKLEGEELKLQ
jgi:hypothetical protein